MGYPVTGTIEVDTVPKPELADLVHQTLTDPCGKREELLLALTGKPVGPGHMCINAWVFSPDFSQVLLVQHPRFGWTIPGGHLDPGEDPLIGAQRELLEETGISATAILEIPIALVVATVPEIGQHQEHIHYTLSYSFFASSNDPLMPEEGQPAKWFSLDEELPEGHFGDNWHAYKHVEILKHYLNIP